MSSRKLKKTHHMGMFSEANIALYQKSDKNITRMESNRPDK